MESSRQWLCWSMEHAAPFQGQHANGALARAAPRTRRAPGRRRGGPDGAHGAPAGVPRDGSRSRPSHRGFRASKTAGGSRRSGATSGAAATGNGPQREANRGPPGHRQGHRGMAHGEQLSSRWRLCSTCPTTMLFVILDTFGGSGHVGPVKTKRNCSGWERTREASSLGEPPAHSRCGEYVSLESGRALDGSGPLQPSRDVLTRSSTSMAVASATIAPTTMNVRRHRTRWRRRVADNIELQHKACRALNWRVGGQIVPATTGPTRFREMG